MDEYEYGFELSDSSSEDDSSYSSEGSYSSSESEIDQAIADANNGFILNLGSIQTLRKSTSEGNFDMSMMKQWLPESFFNRRQEQQRRLSGEKAAPTRVVYAIQTKSPLESHTQFKDQEASIPKPKETLMYVLRDQGIAVKNPKSVDIPEFFVASQVTSFSLHLMNAIRQNDVATVRAYHEAGCNLQCGNKFGESLVHAAARRGNLPVLKYMAETAGVSLRVCCDGGRTPLHDACWTSRPDFDTIRYLLEDCPDFLSLHDNRNFTPLDFIPKDSHEVWNQFLEDNKELVKPKGLF